MIVITKFTGYYSLDICIDYRNNSVVMADNYFLIVSHIYNVYFMRKPWGPNKHCLTVIVIAKLHVETS